MGVIGGNAAGSPGSSNWFEKMEQRLGVAPWLVPPNANNDAIMQSQLDQRVHEVQQTIAKHGGNMGTEGSVAFQFKHCGQFVFAPGTDEDKVMEVALEAGAEDVVTDDDGAIEVITAPGDFEAVKNALEAAGLKPEVAEVTMRAENTVDVTGEDAAKMQKLLDVLEDLDDVQEVYHNASLSE